MPAISGRSLKILIYGINKVHISVHDLMFLEFEMCRLLLQGFFCVILRKSADISWFSYRFTTCIEPVRGVTLLNSSEIAAVCAALLRRKAKLPVFFVTRVAASSVLLNNIQSQWDTVDGQLSVRI